MALACLLLSTLLSAQLYEYAQYGQHRQLFWLHSDVLRTDASPARVPTRTPVSGGPL